MTGLAVVVPFLASVTFSAPAAPASRLLPQLGTKLGLKLEAGPRVAGEVLLVRVSNVAPADLFRQVAAVAGGEWTEKDGVYRLDLDSGLVASEARRERIEKGQAWIDQARRQQEQRAKKQYGDSQSGVAELIVASMSPEFLGGLGFKERVVFSTRPTPMQRPFTRSMLANVDLSKLTDRGILRFGPETPVRGGPVSVVQFVIQAGEDGRSLRFALEAADATGRISRGETGQLYQSYGGEPFKVELPKPEAPVGLTKEDQVRNDLLRDADPSRNGMNMGANESGGSVLLYSEEELGRPSLLGRLPEVLRPESIEPLSLAGGPLFGRLAESQNLNLVADLPDGALRPSLEVGANPTTQARWTVAQLSGAQTVRLAVKNGWMLVRPYRPAEARANRLDRSALGTALRILAQKGSLDLEARVAYAAAAPLAPAEQSIDGLLFGVVNSDYGKRIAASSASGERQFLRVYRSLGLPSSTTKAFGSLPGAARIALNTLVFNASDGPQRSTQVRTQSGFTTLYASDNAYSMPYALDGERTVYWPNGIPANAEFKYTDTLENTLFGLAASGARPQMDANGGGYGMSYSSNGPMKTWTSRPRLSSYVQGKLRRVAFEIIDGENARFTRQAAAESIAADAPVIAYEKLPESMRKSIDEMEANIRRSVEENERQRQIQENSRGVKP